VRPWVQSMLDSMTGSAAFDPVADEEYADAAP
jgi:hypothetical protein